MIHDEICTYEVAKLAREKGFDVQTFDWYDCAGNYHKGFIPHELHECPRYKEYYAPSQSLLQRWLREEKYIDIAIVSLYSGGYSYIVYNIHCRDNRVVNTNVGYATYELALEDALKYALENLV